MLNPYNILILFHVFGIRCFYLAAIWLVAKNVRMMFVLYFGNPLQIFDCVVAYIAIFMVYFWHLVWIWNKVLRHQSMPKKPLFLGNMAFSVKTYPHISGGVFVPND